MSAARFGGALPIRGGDRERGAAVLEPFGPLPEKRPAELSQEGSESTGADDNLMPTTARRLSPTRQRRRAVRFPPAAEPGQFFG